jgi:hypothetical protein
MFVRFVGAFESNNAPDDFASSKNALFNPGGSLTNTAYWYVRHFQLFQFFSSLTVLSCSLIGTATPLNPVNIPSALDPALTTTTNAIHCDATCLLRNAEIESYKSALAGTSP